VDHHGCACDDVAPVEEVNAQWQSRKVERVIVHSGYKPLPKELQSGDIARHWTAGAEQAADFYP